MGNEIYQTFGHTAFRVIDSNKSDSAKDLIYNYGNYDFFNGSFFWTFVSGKLVVSLAVVRFDSFMHEYRGEGRSMEEQLFLLDDKQKEQILAFLENNAQIENKCYVYQIFFDNCCTRSRDVFPQVFGKDFVIGAAIPRDVNLSYRTAVNLYYRNRYWERMGINICMGHTTDTIIANKMITFLPEFLSIGMAGATLNGKKVCADKTTILEDHINHAPGINQPFILSCLICFVTIVSLSFKRFRKLGNVMSFLILALSVFFGVCILVHWFYSEHVYGQNNFNILWALPTNTFIAFFKFRGKGAYGLIGMGLIMFCVLLHILKIQIMPLFETGPYLLALFCVYGNMYRNRVLSQRAKASPSQKLRWAWLS